MSTITNMTGSTHKVSARHGHTVFFQCSCAYARNVVFMACVPSSTAHASYDMGADVLKAS